MCNKSFFFFDVIRIIHYIAESNYIQFNRKKNVGITAYVDTTVYIYSDLFEI